MEIKKSYLDGQDLALWQQAWLNQCCTNRPLQHESNSMDIFGKLTRVSKSAFVLFNELKNNSDPDFNIAHVDFTNLTEGQAVTLRRNLAALCKAGVIVKVKKHLPSIPKITKQTYMINPYDLKCLESTTAQNLWELNT